MSAWITAIVGVVVLGVLLEIILPEGEVTKYIRGIFSIIVVVVIITPIAQALSGEKKFNFDIDSSQIEIDNNYIDYFNKEHRLSDEKTITDMLIEKNLSPLNVEISLKEGGEYRVEIVKLYYLPDSLESLDKTKVTDLIKKGSET